ncbi:MAG: DUF1501 domain-containing protein [Candidatus Sumerlaeia bacterium]|nr:DUF1501 domain-containing protein [Candidatus Sumerlaeia bacterium]
MNPLMSRRRFLASSSSALATLSYAGAPQLFFTDPADAGLRDILIVVFLRGGADTLNLVVPFNDPNYIANRPALRIPPPGQTNGAIDLNGQFGLHPNAQGLKNLYDLGDLAIVNAVGVMDATRSHFDAQDYLEKGVPGDKSVQTGWLKRHLDRAGTPAVIRGLSVGSSTATVFAGDISAISMTNASSFIYDGEPSSQQNQMRLCVRRMYQGTTWLEEVANQALDTSDIIEASAVGTYNPENGAVYPNTTFASNLRLVAQVAKLNLGLQCANIDVGGGWDTHENQAGTFSNLVSTVSQGLEAFWTDMTAWRDRITLCVVTEFGRRLRENASIGTDHGHAWAMMILSGAIQGGQLYGQWPGLALEQLDNRTDLAITTDYRAVLGEILIQRVGNPDVGYVFPGVNLGEGLGLYGPLPSQEPAGIMLR